MKYEGTTSGFAGKTQDRAERIVEFLEDRPGQVFTRSQLRSQVLRDHANKAELSLVIEAAMAGGKVKSGKRKIPNRKGSVTVYWTD
jgi:hypothetical protein